MRKIIADAKKETYRTILLCFLLDGKAIPDREKTIAKSRFVSEIARCHAVKETRYVTAALYSHR